MEKTFKCACGAAGCNARIVLSSPAYGVWELTTYKASYATRPGFSAHVVLSQPDRDALAMALVNTLG